MEQMYYVEAPLKPDSLWVKWINSYYLKKHNVFETQPKSNSTWLMRENLSVRDCVHAHQSLWNDMRLKVDLNVENTTKLSPLVRVSPRAGFVFIIQLGRVRLWSFGCFALGGRPRRIGCSGLVLLMITSVISVIKEETCRHIFFECAVLNWIQIKHTPSHWEWGAPLDS